MLSAAAGCTDSLCLKRGITYDPILFAAAWVVRSRRAAKTRNTSAGFQNDYGRFIFYCATPRETILRLLLVETGVQCGYFIFSPLSFNLI